MRAGGRATEAGMMFQAAVATWFAVHILVRLPVGGSTAPPCRRRSVSRPAPRSMTSR
jgi:hypothetical protein